MNRLVIPIFRDVIDDFDGDFVELSSRESIDAIFYSIDAVVPFYDETRVNIIGAEINCKGALYYSPLSAQEIDNMIMYDGQNL